MSYTIYSIPTSVPIGDALPYINANYITLDGWLSNLQLSADNIWKPLRDYYLTFSLEFSANMSKVNEYKGNWDSVVTTVQANSAKWLQPLTVVYPNVIPVNGVNPDDSITSEYYNHITLWLNTYFPVVSANTGYPDFVQYQKAYIFVLKQNFATPVAKVDLLQNTINCYTVDFYICNYCTFNYTGQVYCTNGVFDCNTNQSCTICGTSNCYYDQTGTKNYNPILQAYLNINFNDVRESTNITCLTYEVQNCQWSYVSQI